MCQYPLEKSTAGRNCLKLKPRSVRVFSNRRISRSFRPGICSARQSVSPLSLITLPMIACTWLWLWNGSGDLRPLTDAFRVKSGKLDRDIFRHLFLSPGGCGCTGARRAVTSPTDSPPVAAGAPCGCVRRRVTYGAWGRERIGGPPQGRGTPGEVEGGPYTKRGRNLFRIAGRTVIETSKHAPMLSDSMAPR